MTGDVLAAPSIAPARPALGRRYLESVQTPLDDWRYVCHGGPDRWIGDARQIAASRFCSQRSSCDDSQHPLRRYLDRGRGHRRRRPLGQARDRDRCILRYRCRDCSGARTRRCGGHPRGPRCRCRCEGASDIGTDRLRVALLDLSNQASIAAFVAAWRGRLHILVENAGIMATPERRTASFEPNSKDVSYKNIQQGAATSVLLAGSPLVKGVSGTYFEDCVPAVTHVPGVRRGVASYALDPEHAARLWQMSLELIRQGTHRANAGG